MSERKLKATRILRIPLNESSVKIRTGDPADALSDAVWAGVAPFRPSVGTPEPDPVTPGATRRPPTITDHLTRPKL